MDNGAYLCRLNTFLVSHTGEWSFDLKIDGPRGFATIYRHERKPDWASLMGAVQRCVHNELVQFLNVYEFQEIECLLNQFSLSQFDGHYIDIFARELPKGNLTDIGGVHAVAGDPLPQMVYIQVPSNLSIPTSVPMVYEAEAQVCDVQAKDVDLLSIIPF